MSGEDRQSPPILVVIAASLLLTGTATLAETRNVEAWAAGELADYVASQLATLPRFANTPVHFAVLSNGLPASRTNALAIALRDGLRSSLAGRPGVHLGWQAGVVTPLAALPSTSEHCEALRPALFIGIELRVGSGTTARASVRALDEKSRQWVPGFGREWQGQLSARQQRAYRTATVDRTFLGRRDVPYSVAQTDLIASHLARELRCQLMRQVSGEYRLATTEAPIEGDALAAVPALVRHQVGGVSSLRLLAAGEAPNVQLSGMLHPVAGDLYQYWLALDPVAATDELQPLSASVYVSLANGGGLPADTQHNGPVVPEPAAGVLSAMRLVQLAGDPCRQAGYAATVSAGWRGNTRCAALRVTASSDAVVFILNHQRNLGLVKLGDGRCSARARAHIVRRGQSITVPVPDFVAADEAEWSAVPDWSPEPQANVYYAVASSDSQSARAIAKLVSALPARCSESLRPGLEGEQLVRWLAELGAALAQRASETDWLAVQARSVL